MPGPRDPITPEFVADFINSKVRELVENPILNINSLAQLGMVMSALGFLLDNNVLKILGDLLSEAPDKVRPLLSVRYALVGTIGELQAALNRAADEVFRELVGILRDLEKALRSGGWGSSQLAEIAGRLYNLLVVKIPPVSVSTVYGEEE